MNFLVLFFDVNGTIIALDSAQEKTLEITLLQELAKRITARWCKSLKEPISYKRFVHQYLLKGEDPSNIFLIKQRQQRYAAFLTYLSHHHPSIYEETLSQFQAIHKILQQKKGHLFPSFLKLLRQLQHQQVPFSLVLRSFGKEMPIVRQELEEVGVSIQHNGIFKENILHMNGQQYHQGEEILSFLQAGHHHAWQDDWEYWHAHCHQSPYGKPFYLSVTHPITLFFDDNIQEKDIVHICPAKGLSLSKEEAIAQGYLHRVDTLEAIRDEAYFCKKVFAKWEE